MKKKQRICDCFLLCGAAVYNFLVYFGGRYLAKDLCHVSLETAIDRSLPTFSWMILVYWGCYLFWIVTYYLGVTKDRRQGKCFLLSHFIGETVAFFFFVFFPTIMIRPEISGVGIFDRMVEWTYRIDSADNLFPSIHCFVSWLCYIGIRDNEKINKWYRKFSCVMALGVCASTLAVKQHVIMDVLSGILLAESSMLLSKKIMYNDLENKRQISEAKTWTLKQY